MSQRFRIAMWLVVLLGIGPMLASGIGLSRYFRFGSLCAAERDRVSVGELRTLARLRAVHRVGRIGAVVAGALVFVYSLAWARRRSKSARVTVGIAGVVLAVALLAASWTGRTWPWHALEPTLAVEGGQGIGRLAPIGDERGGPAYCTAHLDEVARLRTSYTLHFVAGVAACVLALALAELAARATRS